MPYPFGGVFYQSEDQDAPYLYGVFNGSSDIRLTLPEEIKVTDLKWFSIWSRAEKKSFSEVLFPIGFTLDKKYPTSTYVNSGFNTELPPPRLSGNVHDPRTVYRWSNPEEEGVNVGELQGTEHSISGALYAVDENVLLLKRLKYDGEAKDTFFWVGTSGDRPNTDGTILPYPFGGVFYQSEDQDAPYLYGVFNGSSDIRLTLPEEMKVTELKWFSIWSRAEKKSFGEVLFPIGFTLD